MAVKRDPLHIKSAFAFSLSLVVIIVVDIARRTAFQRRGGFETSFFQSFLRVIIFLSSLNTRVPFIFEKGVFEDTVPCSCENALWQSSVDSCYRSSKRVEIVIHVLRH